MVMTIAGKVPVEGERFPYRGFEFEVRQRTRTRVISVAVSRIKAPVDTVDTME
jgi:CBS domain containing-hemolysin-like protein